MSPWTQFRLGGRRPELTVLGVGEWDETRGWGIMVRDLRNNDERVIFDEAEWERIRRSGLPAPGTPWGHEMGFDPAVPEAAERMIDLEQKLYRTRREAGPPDDPTGVPTWDGPQHLESFCASISGLSRREWKRILSAWELSKTGTPPWGMALLDAEGKAQAAGLSYDREEVGQRIFDVLYKRLEHIFRREEPEVLGAIEFELLQAATVGAKALMLSGFLEPEVFSILYRPFARSVPRRR